MIYERIDVKGDTSQKDARLVLYSLDYSVEIAPSAKRPLVIICPGGAYAWTSDREAEPVAMQYLAAGLHAAVLRYSVKPAVFPTALLELARAVKYLRENAPKYHIDPDRIVISGFSAGGHLAASYATMWSRPFAADALGLKDSAVLKPNGLVLSYPVITSGEASHIDSIKNLLGDDFEAKRDEMSLEKQVNPDTPPAFIWHTQPDDCVPVQNSLLFAQALQDLGIPYEMHIYPEGGHGLGLARREWSRENDANVVPCCADWIERAIGWVKRL